MSYATDYYQRKSNNTRRFRQKGIMNLCVVCRRQVPDRRFKKLTCDKVCERAKKNRRTRQEQIWHE